MKVIIVLGISFLLVALETWLEGTLPFSGLLAVMSMACVLQLKSETFVTRRLAEKFGKLWLAAEVIPVSYTHLVFSCSLSLSAMISKSSG